PSSTPDAHPPVGNDRVGSLRPDPCPPAPADAGRATAELPGLLPAPRLPPPPSCLTRGSHDDTSPRERPDRVPAFLVPRHRTARADGPIVSDGQARASQAPTNVRRRHFLKVRKAMQAGQDSFQRGPWERGHRTGASMTNQRPGRTRPAVTSMSSGAT